MNDGSTSGIVAPATARSSIVDDVVVDTPAVREAGRVARDQADGLGLEAVGGTATFSRSMSAWTGPV